MIDPTALAKALLINAACINAAAVCENTQGGGVPVDPLIKDVNLQGKAVMVYEEAKIQYAALVRAFEDQTGIWPDPKVASAPAAATPSLASLAPEALALLSKLPGGTSMGTIGDVAGLLSKFLPSAAPSSPAAAH